MNFSTGRLLLRASALPCLTLRQLHLFIYFDELVAILGFLVPGMNGCAVLDVDSMGDETLLSVLPPEGLMILVMLPVMLLVKMRMIYLRLPPTTIRACRNFVLTAVTVHSPATSIAPF